MSDDVTHEENPEANGWTRRFTACEPRLSEAIELYRASGFEVLLVNLQPEKTANNCISHLEKEECRECFNGVEEKYSIIYTRPYRSSR